MKQELDAVVHDNLINQPLNWKVTKNEIILRGGKPWGFKLAEGFLLTISHVEEDGKAAKTGLIREGDYIVAINDVYVTDLNDAEDLIDGAFRTLSLTVIRGNLDQGQSHSPNSSFIRDGELDRSQDDSLVYKESPSKKLGTKLKSQRRGESFNLKNTSPAGQWANSESTESVSTPSKRKFSFKKFSFSKRSASTEQKPKDTYENSYLQQSYSVDEAHGSSGADAIGGEPGHYRSQIMQSTPALHQYGAAQNNNTTTSSANVEPTATNSMPHSTSWQPLASQSTSNLDYSNNNKRGGDNTKENDHPPGYRSVFEYKLSQINKSYSTGAIKPSSTSTTQNSHESANRRWRTNNYENVSALETGKPSVNSYKSPSSKPPASSYYVTDADTSQYFNGDRSGAPIIPPKTYGQTIDDEDTGTLFSPSAYNNKQSSWNSSSENNAPHTSDTSLNESNTSWTDTSHTAIENGGNKPSKLFYQPRSFNPRLEEVTSKDVKRHLEENRLKSPRDPPNRQPMVAKADNIGDLGRAFQFDPEYIEAQNSFTEKGQQRSSEESPPHEIKPEMVEVREMATSPNPPLSPSVPPPVPDNSPPQLSPPQPVNKESSVLNDVSWNVVNTPSAGYMYIVRQKPCYNTSTQTDAPPKVEPASPYNLKSPSEPSLRNVEVQAGSVTPIKPRLLKEERGIQARPGSIVAANIAVNSKSVGVGDQESDYDNLNIWNDHGHKTITPSGKSGASENQKGKGASKNENSSRDVKPKSPKSSIVSQQYYIKEDDLAKIHDNPSDTAMLRKLSQEYYSHINASNRHSGNFEDKKNSEIKEEPNAHMKQVSDDKGYCSGIESKVSKATKNTLLEMRKDIESYERQENLKKGSVRPFEPVDYNDNRKHFLSTQAQSNVLTKNNIEHQQRQSTNKDINESMEIKQLSIDSGVSSIVDNHRIVEHMRKEWIQSGEFDKHGRPKALKRTVSEQIRPERSQASSRLTKGIKSVSSAAESENERTPTISDGNNLRKLGDHAHQGSDPTQDHYRFHNSRKHPENRWSTDSEDIFNSEGMDHRNRNSNVSNKSSSSGSTGAGDDRSRTSDPDLKKLQQKALLNFMEMKKSKKRSSSSSMDSSFSSELQTPKDSYNKDWRHQKSPSSPFKSNDSSKKSTPQSLDKNSRRHSTNSGPHLSSRRKDIINAELSPPSLLDTSMTSPPAHNMRGHSYSSSSATSTSMSPGSDPQSPPLHPWPSDSTPSKIEEEETDVKERIPSETTEPKRGDNQSKSSNDVSKAIQYSTSSTESSPPVLSPTRDKFAYQVSMNRSFMEEEDDHTPAPSLPPRNYRSNYSSRQVPQPMEPPKTPPYNSSSKLHDHTQILGRQSSSGQSTDSNGGRPQPDSGRSSTSVQQPGSTRFSSSSYTDTEVFTGDFDNTPARDTYAEQLRRFSQSKNSYLNAAKFQQRPISNDLKTNVAVSRPVEKPSIGTSQPLLNSSVISSKDYTGLSDNNNRLNIQSPTTSTNNSAKGNSDRQYNGSRHSIGSTHSNDLPVISRGIEGGRYSISSAGELNSYQRGVYHSPQGSTSSDRGVYLSPMPTSHSNNDIIRSSQPQAELRRSSELELQRELDELPPPPPPPPHQPIHHHHSPSASLLEDKPLPPLPTDTDGHHQPEQRDRFSSDSYINNKSNYRKAYAGNYHSNSVTSPKTPTGKQPSPSINPPRHDTMVQVTKVLTVNNTSIDSAKDTSSPPWNQPYSPVQTYNRHSPSSMDTPNSRSEVNRGHMENGTEQESAESPSVKSFVATFETRENYKRSTDKGPVTRSKVSELKQTLMRNSNENLSEICSLEGKRSRSNSKENILLLNNSVSSEDIRGNSPRQQHSNLPSSTEDIPSKHSSNSNLRTGVPDIRECRHSRERSDPQSDGDTRSNDSGVAEDISHIRQKSQEEIDCEKQALLVASQLKDQDKQLSEVILPRPEYKSSTDYVSGLFDTKVNVMHKPSIRVSTLNRTRSDSSKNKSLPDSQTPSKSESSLPPQHSPYWSPPPLADLQNRMRQENVDDILKDINSTGENIEKEKGELIGRIEKKVEILKEERTILEEEIQENEALGRELSTIVEQKLESKAELNKYTLYVTELDKVTILLLKLSGRLARAENGIMSLKEDASEKERSVMLTKRDELQEKLEDAKSLKEGIDRRSNQVAVFLKKHLTSEEFGDYGHFIKMKSKLTIDQQEIEDKLKLGDEQLAALKKSMNQSDC